MFKSFLHASVGACLFVALTLSAQTPSFTVSTADNLWTGSFDPDGMVHADLNGDGREDFLSVNSSTTLNSGCSGAFAVSLSTGDGTYAAPVCYTTPSGSANMFAVADFNGDGKFDLLASDNSDTAWLYLNDGSGKLRLANAVSLPGGADGLVATDVNHDGAMDVVYLVPNPYTSPQQVTVLFGDNSGLFQTGPTTSFSTGVEMGQLDIGDFDGDGQGDLFVHDYGDGGAVILYGDGTGHYTAGTAFGGLAVYAPADILGNGIMDAIANPSGSSGEGSNIIDIEFGNPNRTLTSRQVTLANCTQDGAPPFVADFDGDGIADIIVPEGSSCGGGGDHGPYTLNFLKGNGNGTFQPEQVIYNSDYEFQDMRVLRATHSSRPDITAMLWDDRPYAPPDWHTVLMVNTTQGPFPPCKPLNFRATGMAVCGPKSTVLTSSTVNLSFAGAGQTPAHDLEVWIDGKKVASNRKHSFSRYDFVNTSVSLSNGKHTVSAVSVGWDHSELRYKFPLTIGSSTCAPPAEKGLAICAPFDNGEISSPVLAWAAGNAGGPISRMEVWVDGVKRYSTHGSNTLKTQIAVAAGHHRFTYFLVAIDGTKWEQAHEVWVP